MAVLSEVVELLHGWFPPETAESWDAVGLVSGDPDAAVGKVMFAVDPTLEVAHEAAEWGADLLVVHHPLFLKPVHGVARTTPKGLTLGALADAGCALLTAHTNADQAAGGVSEAMATAFGLDRLRPLVPAPAPELDLLTVCVPVAEADRLRSELGDAGAGRLGHYDYASYTSVGEGRFRPRPGARPAIGEVGRAEVVEEVRIEVVAPRSLRARLATVVLGVHPYEQPVYWFTAMEPDPTHAWSEAAVGSGRIGLTEPTTLGEFAARVAAALPATAHGVRVAGDPDRPVERVALCGGAGDAFLGAPRLQGADVYVTSDLRHHPAAEFLEADGPALIDVAHWAAEWTWLPVVEARLREALADRGDDTVDTRVSTWCTDPWTFRI